ncbi:MAG: MFS transporter [Synergistaceae bacterium]|nr:MFS transporter [Synergistaceae bacterium]
MSNETKYQNTFIVSFVLLFAGASISMHQFKVPTIMDDVAQSLSMSAASAPWLMSVFTVTGILLSIAAGGFVQKMKSKRLFLAAAVFMALGSFVGAYARTGSVMLGSRVLEGLGFLIAAVAGPITVGRYCAPGQIGRAMGIWAVWVATGQIAAFNLTPALMGAMGWRGIWQLYAVITLAMAAVLALTLREPAGIAPAQRTSAGPAVSPMPVLKNRHLIFASLSFAIFNLLLLAVLTFLPGYAVQSGLMSVPEASFAATIPMIGCLIGSPIMGKLSETYGRKWLYVISILASGAGTFLAFSSSRPVIYAGVILFGLIGLGAPGMVMGAIAGLVDRPEQEGAGMGILITFQNLGMFLGTSIFLPIVGIWSGNYFAAGLTLAAVSLAGAVLAGSAKMK